MPGLSEANYLSRRLKLTHQIGDAQRAYTEAAYRLELGKGDEAAVTAARETVDTLKARLSGLESAWDRTKADIVAAKVASERSMRQAAVGQIERHLSARLEAGKELADAAQTLARAHQRFEAANAGIVAAVAPFGQDIGKDMRSDLSGVLKGEFYSILPLVGGIMADAGLVMSTNNFTKASFRQQARSLPEYIEHLNDKIRGYTAAVGQEVAA